MSLLKKKWFPIGACVAVFLFGGLFQPGEWYENLNRAPWNPPNWVFPVAWTFLYTCIAIVGFRLVGFGYSKAYHLWLVQLGLNAIWSWLFFGQQLTILALIDLVLLLSLVCTLIFFLIKANRKLECYLMVPYAAWLTLAVSLNAYIVLYN